MRIRCRLPPNSKLQTHSAVSSVVCTYHNDPETLLVWMWELRPPTHPWLSPRSAGWWIPRWSWSLYLFRFCSHTSLQCSARPAPPTMACQYHWHWRLSMWLNLLPSGSSSAFRFTCFCSDLANFTQFFQLCSNSVCLEAKEASGRNSPEFFTTHCSCSQIKTVRFSPV